MNETTFKLYYLGFGFVIALLSLPYHHKLDNKHQPIGMFFAVMTMYPLLVVGGLAMAIKQFYADWKEYPQALAARKAHQIGQDKKPFTYKKADWIK